MRHIQNDKPAKWPAAAASGFSPARKAWQSPQVIVGTMDQAEVNIGFGADGGGTASSDS